MLVNPFEVGGEECVLRDDYSAWVGGVAVIPVGEAVAFRRYGSEGGGVAIPKRSAAGHLSVKLMVGDGGELEGDAVGEIGNEVCVLREEDGARVASVAVVPASESVTGFRGGSDDYICEVRESSVARGGALCRVGALCGYVVEIYYGKEWTPILSSVVIFFQGVRCTASVIVEY